MNDDVPNLFLLPSPISFDMKHKGRRRDAEAARLKALGWSLLEIAKRLDLGDEEDVERAEARAAAAIKRSMAEAVRFARDEARHLELIALDELELRLWKLLDDHPALVQHGKLVLHPFTDEPIEDVRFALEVMDRITKVRDQRAKVTGIYAPTRSEVITLDGVEAMIAELEESLGKGKKTA